MPTTPMVVICPLDQLRNAGCARRLTQGALDYLGFPHDDDRVRVELGFHEVFANTTKHGEGDDRAVTLYASNEEHRIVATVTQQNTWRPPETSPQVEDESGRGLALIAEAFGERFEITDDGRRIRIALDAPSTGAADA